MINCEIRSPVTGQLPLAFTQDFKATAQAYLALASVLLGDISGGLAHGREAVAHAEQLRHPHSICYALSFLAGDTRFAESQPWPTRSLSVPSHWLGEYGFPLWLAGGQMLRGCSRMVSGKASKALQRSAKAPTTWKQPEHRYGRVRALFVGTSSG